MRLRHAKSLEERIAERHEARRRSSAEYESDHFDIPTAKYVLVGVVSLVVLFHVLALGALFFTE